MTYVMMAVPADLVPAVTEFIEGRHAGHRDAVAPGAEAGGFPHGWDRGSVRRAYRESADNMRELLDFLSSHPGREVSSYELADSIEAKYGWNTVAGMLGAFGRRCANRYGLTQPMWEFRYDADGRVLITMSKETAEALRKAVHSS